MQSIRSRTLSTLLLAGLALLAGACADLSGIQHFAATSARSAEYTRLVDAYVAHPNDLARYGPVPELEEQTRARTEQRKRLLALHRAVEEYMSAVARLASDQVVDYDAHYDALGTALADARFAEAAQAEAVQRVGGILTRAVADGYRQKELGEVIAEGNAPLQVILGRLLAIASAIADETAGLEAVARNYYRTAIQETGQPGVDAILAGWQYRDAGEIARQRRAAETYRQALTAIGQGHQDLYDHRDALETDEVRRQMTRYAREIRSAIGALRDF